MRQSKLFTKTRREAPTDETAKNAQLLIRGGYIHKEMAGVYSYLPLGLRVIKNIEEIIRQEMNGIGGIEMRTSVLQSKDVWEKSGRWSDDIVDNWFKTKFKNGGEAGLSFTNEEAYSNILRQHIDSHKDLPVYPYDFKEIFRNEARSKSGLMRGREFYWKALYSFSKDEAEHNDFYEKAKEAYMNVFKRAGIGDLTYITFASGGTFSKFSHEFQTVTEAGEDIIYIDEKKRIAVNKEVLEGDILKDLGLKEGDLKETKAIEVGNIFTLGTKFSKPFDLKYKNENGEETLVFMGSYGIGLGRLMGAVVEILSDKNGIIWPEEIAPFKAHLLLIGDAGKDLERFSDGVYSELCGKGIEVLYDDRIGVSAGEKFFDADLMGMPWRAVMSEKTMAEGKIEVKKRGEEKSEIMEITEFIKKIK